MQILSNKEFGSLVFHNVEGIPVGTSIDLNSVVNGPSLLDERKRHMIKQVFEKHNGVSYDFVARKGTIQSDSVLLRLNNVRITAEDLGLVMPRPKVIKSNTGAFHS